MLGVQLCYHELCECDGALKNLIVEFLISHVEQLPKLSVSASKVVLVVKFEYCYGIASTSGAI